MGRRYRLKSKPGAYVERDSHGRFKKWTGVGRSIRVDRRVKAKHVPSRGGYGHLGDYQHMGEKLTVQVRKKAEEGR